MGRSLVVPALLGPLENRCTWPDLGSWASRVKDPVPTQRETNLESPSACGSRQSSLAPVMAGRRVRGCRVLPGGRHPGPLERLG